MCVLDALVRLMPMHIQKCDVGEGRTWWQCNAKRGDTGWAGVLLWKRRVLLCACRWKNFFDVLPRFALFEYLFLF